MEEPSHSFIPRPPPSKSMADFVVTVFVIVIATSIMLAVIGTGLIIIFRPTAEVAGLIAVINDLITMIIGALIGFISGRAQGRSETENKKVSP